MRRFSLSSGGDEPHDAQTAHGNFETAPGSIAATTVAMRENLGPSERGIYRWRWAARDWIDHWIQPFRVPAGPSAGGVICGWLDITEHRQLIDELEEAKNHSRRSEPGQDHLPGDRPGHEIRTPMNAVVGVKELGAQEACAGSVRWTVPASRSPMPRQKEPAGADRRYSRHRPHRESRSPQPVAERAGQPARAGGISAGYSKAWPAKRA